MVRWILFTVWHVGLDTFYSLVCWTDTIYSLVCRAGYLLQYHGRLDTFYSLACRAGYFLQFGMLERFFLELYILHFVMLGRHEQYEKKLKNYLNITKLMNLKLSSTCWLLNLSHTIYDYLKIT